MAVYICIIFIIASVLSMFEVDKSSLVIKENPYTRVQLIRFFSLVLILVLIATFRSPNMPDYFNYTLLFQGGYGVEETRSFEVGFTFLVDQIRKVTSNNLWYFAIFSTISVSISILAIERESHFFWLSIVIY